MKFVENINKNQVYQIIFVITIFLFLPKWILSFIYFDEDITLRIISEVSDTTYFPLIKSFSEFDLSPSYSEDLKELKLVAFPFLSLIINSIFFKVFASYSFIILEFLCIFLFLVIFYKLFSEFRFNNLTSILFSTFLYFVTYLIFDLSLLDNNILKKINLNFQTFYSLRFPRPIISNLFLFMFILISSKFYLSEKINLKLMFYNVLIMCFTLHIFFYLFIFQLVLIYIIYQIKFKFTILSFLKKYFKEHLIFIILIIFSILIFQYQLYYAEPEYSKRIGYFSVDLEQKKILINYLINFFGKIEFIALFLINTLLYFLFKSSIIRIFYIFFISTIISTIFFLIIYNKGIDYYHFFNWILASGFLTIIISSLLFLNNKFLINLNSSKAFKIQFFLLVLILFYFNLSSIFKQINVYDKYNSQRIEQNELSVFFDENTKLLNPKYEILIFDYNFSLWLILNNYNNLSLVPVSFWTSKKTSTIETELISAFKIFNLSKIDFINFLSNKIKGKRIKNAFVQKLYDRTYLANQIKIFDSKNLYTFKEKEFIKNSSPLISHQLIIPQNEIDRLKDKFENTDINISPDIIILDNFDYVFNKNSLKINEFCTIYNSEKYKVLVSKNLKPSC